MSDTQTPEAPAAPIEQSPSIGSLGNPAPAAPNPSAPPQQANSILDFVDDKGQWKQGWTQSLPEGMKAFDGTLSKYPNPMEALNALGHATKKLSQKEITGPPPADASPEVVTAYQARVRAMTGAPEKPEGYGIKAPEGMELQPIAGDFAQLAHQYGAQPEFVHKAVDLYNKSMGELIAQSEASKQEQAQTAIAELNKEWGANAATTWQEAKRGIAILGGNPEADSYSVQDIMRMALNADKAFREDKGLISGGDSSRQTLGERKRALETDPAWLNPKTSADQKRNEEIGAELMRIHEAMKRP